MSSNSMGNLFVITCFGESHGKCIGVIIDGCPSGLRLTQEDIQKEVDKISVEIKDAAVKKRAELEEQLEELIKSQESA